KLPVLGLVVQPQQEAPPLLRARDVQEEFSDGDAVPSQVLLEIPDLRESLLPDAVVNQFRREPLLLQDLRVHADDQRFLVVAAVEDADAAALGQALRAAP